LRGAAWASILFPMPRRPVRTEKAPAAVGPYSQAVLSDGWLFVSGQIPLDPRTGRLVEGGAREQAEQALRNVQAVVEAAGLGMDRVVKTTIYLKTLADFSEVNEAYATFFKEPFPARATVEVSALPKGAGIEIDAIAEV